MPDIRKDTVKFKKMIRKSDRVEAIFDYFCEPLDFSMI